MTLRSWSEIEGTPPTNSYSENGPTRGFPRTEEASRLLAEVQAGKKLSKEDVEKEKRKYRRQNTADVKRMNSDQTQSNMGFGKPGEKNTDEDAPEDNEDIDTLDGFQLVSPADEEIVERKDKKKFEEEGYADNPAQAKIVEEENDHLIGVSHEVKDFADINEAILEERFETAKARKLLTQVNIEKEGKVYDTRIDIDRISNHRQKKWLKHHGGNLTVEEFWNEASFVEIMVRSHGETQVVLHSAAKNGEQGKELRLDTDDFFAMFSISEINKGNSRFQHSKFRLNNPADEIRIKTFFEKVTVNGKKVGAKKEGTPTIIKITPWEPREASDMQKEMAKDTRQPLPWHESNLTGNASDKPGWPEKVRTTPTTDVNSRDIWKHR